MSSRQIINKINNDSLKQFRATKIRVDILECLEDGSHSHTIKDIINHLHKNGKKVNVSSVYNTINFLVNEGIIEIGTDLKTREQSFEIINKKNPHVHLYDVQNNKLEQVELPKDILNKIYNLLDQKGYEYESIRVELFVKKKQK
ncbi:MAG: transcriptional repressor [Malacoplasma sp.]|nr:transcriptional repressor [Malacoplasma sp.]